MEFYVPNLNFNLDFLQLTAFTIELVSEAKLEKLTQTN